MSEFTVTKHFFSHQGYWDIVVFHFIAYSMTYVDSYTVFCEHVWSPEITHATHLIFIFTAYASTSLCAPIFQICLINLK